MVLKTMCFCLPAGGNECLLSLAPLHYHVELGNQQKKAMFHHQMVWYIQPERKEKKTIHSQYNPVLIRHTRTQ
jgi:hypothetical protein